MSQMPSSLSENRSYSLQGQALEAQIIALLCYIRGMPAKNRLKQYIEDSYYHIYNRGVEKRVIFQDDQDYHVFLSYLKEYLLPKDEERLLDILSNPSSTPTEKDKAVKALHLNNFFNEINLISFCLMPNHFHFLVKQRGAGSIDRFINSLCTRYSMYFNRKYRRVGSLYQGVYKAVIISTDEQLIQLTKYIHRQSLSLASQGQALEPHPSSYQDYLGKRKTEWVKPEDILEYFSKNNPSLLYKAFVEENDEIILIDKLLLED